MNVERRLSATEGNMDPIDTGALPASGRFERMERALNRIEDKLDSLPTGEAFRSLEHRVAMIESGATPFQTGYIRTVDRLSNRVDDFEAHGSSQARAAEALAREVHQRVDALEREADRRLGATQDRVDSTKGRYDRMMMGLALVAGANASFNIAQALGAFH